MLKYSFEGKNIFNPLENRMQEVIDTFVSFYGEEYRERVYIMVGGWNFGCGSSREHAPLVIKASGTACVIAKSFARIFYRNAINIGFPIMECPEAVDGISPGDSVTVNFATGVIENETTGQTFQAAPFPDFVNGIIEHGGLLHSLKARGIAK